MFSYITKNKGSPICFIGTSNGSRIAMHLEQILRIKPSKIFLSSISGVFFGTRKIYLRYLFTHPDVYQELGYACQSAKNLIIHGRQALQAGSLRKFEFYASREDSQISPFNSSLPLLGHNEKFYLLEKTNHNHIISQVLEFQITNCIKWLKINSP